MSGENELQFSDTPSSVSLPPPASPSFPVSHPGVPEEDTAVGLDLCFLEPVVPMG